MTGIELEEVHAVLVECFDQNSFAFFLKTRMDEVLANIAGAGPFNNVVFEVLSVAEQEGWDALLDCAGGRSTGRCLPTSRPWRRNTAARSWGSSRPTPATPRSALPIESWVSPRPDSRPRANWAGWRNSSIPATALSTCRPGSNGRPECQGPICRVEIDNEAMGTGFLVGPSAVLTNHHVLAKVIAEPKLIPKVKLRFDYKRLRDGTILSGTLVAIRKILDHSPATDGELAGDPEKDGPHRQTTLTLPWSRPREPPALSPSV